MTGRKWAVVLTALALTVLAMGACGDDSDDSADDEGDDGGAAAQTLTVTATDFQFDQTSITLEPGVADVTLVNDGDVEHSFTSDDLGEVEAEPGQEESTTFTIPDGDATFEFYCKYHPDQMTGTITVGAGSDTGGTGDTDEDKGADY